MTQFVAEPTRGSNILDLILSNNFSLIHLYDIMEAIMSYHKLITAREHLNKIATVNYPEEDCIQEASLHNLNFCSPEVKWDHVRAEFDETDWMAITNEKHIDEILNVIISSC